MRHRSSHNERGAVLVEFAMVLPIFLFVIFEMVNFGLMFSFRQAISQAAAEGARAAAVAPSYWDGPMRFAEAKTEVESAFAGQPGGPVTCAPGSLLTCTVTDTPTGCASDPSWAAVCRVSVKLDYAYADRPNPVPHVAMPPLDDLVRPGLLTYTASARVK